jgi:hypothetical protein
MITQIFEYFKVKSSVNTEFIKLRFDCIKIYIYVHCRLVNTIIHHMQCETDHKGSITHLILNRKITINNFGLIKLA